MRASVSTSTASLLRSVFVSPARSLRALVSADEPRQSIGAATRKASIRRAASSAKPSAFSTATSPSAYSNDFPPASTSDPSPSRAATTSRRCSRAACPTTGSRSPTCSSDRRPTIGPSLRSTSRTLRAGRKATDRLLLFSRLFSLLRNSHASQNLADDHRGNCFSRHEVYSKLGRERRPPESSPKPFIRLEP